MSRRGEERRHHGVKAYLKKSFLTGADARPLRILSEYLEPKARFDHLAQSSGARPPCSS